MSRLLAFLLLYYSIIHVDNVHADIHVLRYFLWRPLVHVDCTGEKLELLMCLAHHLLSFVTQRDYLDETIENLHQARLAYRDDKAAEKKREKESSAEKYERAFVQ